VVHKVNRQQLIRHRRTLTVVSLVSKRRLCASRRVESLFYSVSFFSLRGLSVAVDLETQLSYHSTTQALTYRTDVCVTAQC